MSNEEEKRCPLCAEELDWTDQQFMPCKCGYQICVWCWHHIIDMAEKDEAEGRCPACRSIYEKEKIVAMQANCERTMMKISNRKMKPPKAKPKANDVKKDLTNVRVIQRKMAYVIGLPLSLADEDVLIRKEYFGQYGKVTKVSLSRTAGGAIQQFVNDTCSAYITYSKEEEALRCIQSVHGFILEGKYLRASFGTAKYCHAWLKNMPCNNPSCLYLHSIGTDEDSFGKDEVAAVHTRSRVQQIVGATNNVAKRSGSVLPPADDMYNGGCTSTEISPVRTEDASHGSANSAADMTHSLSFKEKEGAIAVPHKMTSFVDIVGRSNSISTEKDNNGPEDRRFFDQCLELSSVTISGDVHTRQSYSIPAMFEVSSSNCSGNGFFKTNPDEPLRKYSSLSSNQGSEDTYRSSHRVSFLHPSHAANISEDSDGQTLPPKRAHSVNDFTVDRNSVHSREDKVSLPNRSLNMVSNDFSQEVKFQNSTKSDKIYRSSRSFSNEEIVEHLRRIGDDTLVNDEENSALDAVESSIISNIMSIDFDSCEDSLTVPNRLSELLDETYGFGSSSWSSINSDQSGYSFVKQEGFAGQTAGSILPEYVDNKEQYLCRPQYPVSRTQCSVPPGFTVPSRDPPPGFSSSDRVGSVPRISPGGPGTLMPNASSFPSALLQPSSTRLGTGIDDVDMFDPAILSFAKGKQTNGISNPGFATWPLGIPRLSSFEDESRLWLMMQQSHQDSKFSQMFTSEAPPLQQESYAGHLRNRLSGLDDSLSSGLADQHQNCNQSFFTETSQQKYANSNSHFPSANGYQHGMDEFQRHRGGADLGTDERLGVNRYFPGGYGDVMLNSGDVYARRVFGL